MLPIIVAMPLLAAMWIEAPGPTRVQEPEPTGPPEVAVEITAEDQGRGGRGGNQGNSRARRPPSGPSSGGHPSSMGRPPGWYGGPYYPAPPYYYRPWTWGASFGLGWTPFAYAPWGWIYGTAPYGYGWGLNPPYGGTYAFMTGGVRLKLKPRDADVFVDGYYAGAVDDFDGTFQALRLAPGGHKIEVRKPGFETLAYEVHVQPDRTITMRGEMRSAP